MSDVLEPTPSDSASLSARESEPTEQLGPGRLSWRLRQQTAAAHRRAEGSPLMRRLFRGDVGRQEYCRFLRSLWEVYRALERGLADNQEHEAIRGLSFAALHRLQPLAEDLASLHGAGWADGIATGPATAGYVAHLQQIARVAPHLLVAHAYVRYLGDLSGGQLLRDRVMASLALAGDVGTAFYRFPAIPDAGAFKDAYRAALDALPVDVPTAEAIVAEAAAAFERNLAVFDEIDQEVEEATRQRSMDSAE